MFLLNGKILNDFRRRNKVLNLERNLVFLVHSLNAFSTHLCISLWLIYLLLNRVDKGSTLGETGFRSTNKHTCAYRQSFVLWIIRYFLTNFCNSSHEGCTQIRWFFCCAYVIMKKIFLLKRLNYHAGLS